MPLKLLCYYAGDFRPINRCPFTVDEPQIPNISEQIQLSE